MAEREVVVSPVQVEYVCDICHRGTMQPTGKTLLSDPPQYPHECSVCGYATTFRRTYPNVVLQHVKG